MPQAAPLLGQLALGLLASAASAVLTSAFTSSETSTYSPVKTSTGFTFEMQIGESTKVSAVFGTARARGQLMHHNSFGTNNNMLQFVIKAGHGEHDGLEAFLVDEKVQSLSGSNDDPRGRTVDGFNGKLWVKYYTGAVGQIADPELVAQANPASRWTANHKMTGCAYMIVTLQFDADQFGNTVPKFGSVWRGLKMFDWRNPACIFGDPSTYVFTKNPVVMAWNWRRGIYVNGVRILGMGYSAFSNDMAYFTAAANRADEIHYDPETDTSIPVFEYASEIFTSKDRLSVLQEFEASWSGSSFKRGGSYAPLPAQQLVPVMTLEDSDRLQRMDGTLYPVSVDRKGSVSAKKTRLHGQFISQDNGWELSPFVARVNPALQAILGGDRSVALNQPYETNQVRAQYRAETALRRQLFPAMRVETFGPKALVLEAGDAITRNCEWGATLMVVEKVHRLDDRTGVTLTLSEWSNSIVPASGEAFVTLPTTIGTAPAAADRTLAVSALNVQAYQRAGGGSEYPCARATWSQITDPNVEQVMVRLWPSGGTEANDSIDFFGNARLQAAAISEPLAAQTEYTFKAIPIRSDGRTCVWSNTSTFATGAQVAAAVADGAIDLAQLSQELQNITQITTGDVYERIAANEVALGNLALVLLDAQIGNNKLISGLSVRTASAAAGVVRVEKVAIEAGKAVASLQENVEAQVLEISAGGYWGARAEVDEENASVRVFFQARVSLDDDFTDAATLVLGADKVGDDVETFIGMAADVMYFLAQGGEFVSQPFTINGEMSGAYVAITDLRFQSFSSLDQETILMDGETGAVSYTVPEA